MAKTWPSGTPSSGEIPSSLSHHCALVFPSSPFPHVVLGVHGWVSIILFSLGIKFYQTLWVLESSQGPEGAPDGKVLAISGPLVVLGGHGWFPISVFIWNQCLLTTFCSRIDPRARGCPRWPSFGHFRPSCGPRWS